MDWPAFTVHNVCTRALQMLCILNVIGKNGTGCLKKAISGEGPLPSREKPKSAVYPLELPHTIQY